MVVYAYMYAHNTYFYVYIYTYTQTFVDIYIYVNSYCVCVCMSRERERERERETDARTHTHTQEQNYERGELPTEPAAFPHMLRSGLGEDFESGAEVQQLLEPGVLRPAVTQNLSFHIRTYTYITYMDISVISYMYI